MDNLSSDQRSFAMGRVKQKDTRPEIVVRRLLHAEGFRFRLHRKDLPGTPDIVLPKYKSAIFVHGCFWHGHDCKRGRLPETRTEFWREKQQRNQDRDRRVARELTESGFRVLTVWECETKDTEALRVGLLLSLRGA